ncbi:hypothetical protein HQQ81_20135 [Microbacteriaceae bacterium VKM Ac-2854]|nr:hypothetical protein [Microbacteriaceae bacterium VKM Ac-2854]
MFDSQEAGPPPETGGDDRRNARSRQRGLRVAAVVVVGAIALVALLLRGVGVFGGDHGLSPDGDVKPTGVAESTDTGSAESSVADDASSTCGLPGLETSGTLMAAPEAEWTIVGTMAAPDSPASGPGVVEDDGLRRCYAHTVEGAVFMTANMWAMGSDPDLTSLFSERMTAPGPGRDLLLSHDPQRGDSGLRGQIVGFKVVTYSDTDATIDTAFQFTDGRLISFPFAVKWVDGDWKAVVADDGTPSFRPVQLQSLGGYVVWGGLS